MLSTELAESIDRINRDFVTITSIISLIIGLISNINLILVFMTSKTFHNNQCAFYLIVEAFSAIGATFTLYSSNIASAMIQEVLSRVSFIWCKLLLTAGYGFGLCCCYLVCSVAFDQYLSTNHRFNWRQLSSMKLARRLSVGIVTFCSLHCIVFTIFAEVTITGCSIVNPVVRIYFTYFYYPLLNGALPLIISISFSILAFRNVRRIIQRRVNMLRRRLDRQMTALALTRTLCIIILGCPFLIYTIYDLNTQPASDDVLRLTIMNFVSSIIHLTMYLNFCVSSPWWSFSINSCSFCFRSIFICS